MELHLCYDDRYAFSSPIAEISAENAVVKAVSDCGIVACGIGSATVRLSDGETVDVTVVPANLSVLLIIGQSNGEGSTVGDDDPFCAGVRARSVVCPEGQVYTTYAWSTPNHSRWVAGLGVQEGLSPENAASFVAESLTSDFSRAGGKLLYPLNSFAEGHEGKQGFDSALAWNWNRLAGEKVWVVNCAAGGTFIRQWIPGGDRYERCVALMAQVRATLAEEIAKGHYVLNRYVAFWLQGESDKTESREGYLQLFEEMVSNLKKDILLPQDKTLDGVGLISVRAFTCVRNESDICDNGPRLAQKDAVCATEGVCADVFRACAVNDLWITDAAVADYWETVYPDSEYPFTTHVPYCNPVTMEEVHTRVHYLQPGYNEIGMVSARMALRFLQK